MNRLSVHLLETKQARVGFSTGALFSLAKKIIRDHRRLVLKQYGRAITIELIWVSDKEIKKLNKQYRSKNQATDVLSFSFLGQKNETDLLGQLFISVDTLRKQAKAQSHAFKIEAQVLFTHGLLHLLGFDHIKPKDFKQMMLLEQKYLGDKSGLIHRAKVE